MAKNKNVEKARPRNLTIGARITVSTVCAIIIPLIIIASFATFLLSSISSYFDFSVVTTNSYSAVNLIQWSQTLSSISNELASDDTEYEKKQMVNDLASPLEKIGSLIYIEKNGDTFYSSADKDTILQKANQITTVDTNVNINHFSENGVVIVNHAAHKNSDVASDVYLVIIVNEDYVVNDATTGNYENFSAFLFSKTGVLLLLIALLFVVSITILSIITSSTINRPIKKLVRGAQEIAKGNLDYKIDYESTNELGKLVDSFNDMTSQLKESIENQNSAEQSRKETIAGVAHDLRTPLTSIKGYVEGLMDGIANTPEKQQQYLKTIYSSALDTEKMLDDLLTISKLELGNIDLVKKTVCVTEFFDDCAQEISLELEKAEFDFEYTNNCDNTAFVQLDTDRFARVIRNIISNSLKYKKSEEKGKIQLAVESYEKSVIISIADNGIGLESKNLNRIFESFYRADPSRTKVSEGSGIGLAVCKQIVELHGGHIWATSKEGEGLTIFISLEKVVGEQNEKNTDC